MTIRFFLKKLTSHLATTHRIVNGHLNLEYCSTTRQYKNNKLSDRRNSVIGERAFRVAAPRLWNELPSDIRKASTLATFKKHLKTFLFCKHYGTILEQ